MSQQNLFRKQPTRLAMPVRLGVAAVAACFISAPVLSNPLNPTVVNGLATFNQAGKVLTVTNTPGAIIHWQKFSIQAGETTHFAQTSASSSVLNRVLNDPTAIYGTLSSNGRVWLVNPAGIMVGPGGKVDVAAFVASTLNISNADFLAGRNVFINDGTAKNVINQGEIRTPAGGSVYLIGSNVSNEGLITTPKGETILAAGNTVSLIDSATPGVKVDITGSEGNATNLGQITAEAGRIGIAGVIVRNSGLVNASSVVNDGGRIFLKATKAVQLDPASIIRADAGRDGKGGSVLVWGDETAQVDGSISARGGSASGDGGFIETSARKLGIAATARISTHAAHGKAGTWLLDPYDFTIDSVYGDITGAALSAALESNDVLIQTDDGSAFCTGATCGPGNISGNGDIFVNDQITWTSGNQLTLSAYRDIGVYADISSGAGSTLILRADNTGTGVGTVNFDASITTGADGQTHLYYNPPSYASPTDFSYAVSGNLTAWMLVNHAFDLQAMSTNLAGNYALGTDIEASATAFWNAGQGFLPVGDTTTAFTGQFDGLGRTVSSLTINRPATDHVGLFGVASGAVIKNLTLDDASITGQNYVGGLVGSLDGGSIVSSHSLSASISGVQGIGGLAGQIYGNAWVNDSTSSGSVSATDTQGSAGGLVGLMACCGSPILTASDSSADVTGVGYLGGLVGWMQNGQINSSTALGSVTGSGNSVGGLVGRAGQDDADSPALVTSSWASGSVSGVDNVGGLVGENSQYSTVTNSWYGFADVGGGANVGGLVGGNSGTIVDSTARTSNLTGVRDVGGLVGFNSDVGVVTNSHYNLAEVSINGASRVTQGALYNDQYVDWMNHAMSLDIGDYAANLPLVGGYHEINSPAGLKDLLGFAGTPGLKFRLAADLDLSADTDGLHIPYFAALELDGAGHVVTGFNLSLPNHHVAFIGRLDAGTVTNIGIVGGSVSGEGGVGGLVGLNNGGTVSNAYSTATIMGGDGYDIGGLVGFNSGGTVSDSHAGGNVTGGAGSTRTGGLVGANFGTINNSHATGTVSGWREVGGLAGGHGGNISNSWATGPVSGTGNDVGGLVGRVWYGSISDSYATGNVNNTGNNTGGLIGYNGYQSPYPPVIRSYATGTVTGTYNVGGLVGYNWYASIDEAYSTGAVSGDNQVGGLAGENRGNISNSYSTGTVSGSDWVGGLVGAHISNTINNSYSTGAVSGTNWVGGLVGGNWDIIDNSYSTGVVTGIGYSYSIGGLVGENRGGIITNAYSTGDVSGYGRVGGLVGENYLRTIDNSYSTGAVSGSIDVGGLVGLNSSGTISNSFWDVTTSGQPDLFDGRGTGLTTVEMQTADTFTGAGWSATYWNIADGAYPTLKNMPFLAGCVGYDNCWTGAIDSLWATAGNWTAGLPGGSQTVKIDVAGTPTISLVGVNPSFGSLWLAENLDVDAGVSFTLSNLFTLTSGTATFNGDATMANYAQTGGILTGSSEGIFTVTNSFLRSGGSIDGDLHMGITQTSGPLNFSATRVGSVDLNASSVVLGPIGWGGNFGVTTDSLTVSDAVTLGSLNLSTKTRADIVLGRTDLPSALGVSQASLDNISAAYMYFTVPSGGFAVDSGSATPVVLSGIADYLYPVAGEIAITSPLTLSQPGTALYLGASRIDINATPTVGAGGVFLGKNASNVAYLVGVGSKTYPVNTVELTNAELRRIDTTGPIIIGDPYNAHNVNHGPMQIVGPIDLTDTATQLRLVGNGITQAPGATITVPQLAADGYGSISLPEANQVGTFAAKSTNGGISFASAGPLVIGKVETTASPYNFATTGMIAYAGSPVTVTAAGPLTISAAAGQQVPVFGAEVWLNFNGDLSLNAGPGGQAYVEAALPSTIHLDFANSSGVVRFNGVTATAPTNGLAGPGTPNFIGFWNEGVAAVEGSTLLLTNTGFSFGGISCPGYDNCWTGAVNSLWATGGNWTAGHAPTGSESARVDVAGTPTISILGVNPSFGSLWLAENLDVDAGVNFTLSNLFTLNTGTATFDGTASVNSYAQTGGTLAGSGAFTVTNNFVRTGGSINRNGAMSVTQATGALNFAATQVGNLTLRAIDPAAGAILLGPLAGAGTLDVRAARGVDLGGAVTVAGNAHLVAGWDGNETPTPVLRGDGIGSVNLGHDLASSGPTGEIRVWAAGDIAQSAGRSLSAYDVLLAGGRDMSLAGTTSVGRHLDATAKRDILVSGSLHGQTVIVAAGRDLTVSGDVTLTPTGYYLDLAAGADYDIDLDDWTPSVTGGNLMLTASSRLEMAEANHVLNLSTLNGSERSGSLAQLAGSEIVLPNLTDANILAAGSLLLDSITAGPGSIASLNAGYNWGTATYLGTAFDMSLGTVDFSGGTINAQTTGAIRDGNGATLNTSANAINLTSRLGGASAEAIDLDVAASAALSATVNPGAAYGGIFIRNTGAAQPFSLSLSDNAMADSAVTFTHTGSDLTLDSAYHSFSTYGGTGSILVAAPSNNLTYTGASGMFDGSSTILAAGNDLTMNGSLYISGYLGLAADNALNINRPVEANNIELAATAINVNGPIRAYNNAALVSTDVINLSGSVQADGTSATPSTLSGIPYSGIAVIANNVYGSGSSAYLKASSATGDISALISGSITLDNGAYFQAGNDVDLTFTGASSTISLSNGGHVLANAPSTIYLDFTTRSSGGVMIDGTETTTSLPGGSGFFVLSHATPATTGAGGGLVIDYPGSAANLTVDPCASSPDLCKPPAPVDDPVIDVVEANPCTTAPDSAQCKALKQDDEKDKQEKDEFGAEDDGNKKETSGKRRLAQCGI